jgi:hypothetical protein
MSQPKSEEESEHRLRTTFLPGRELLARAREQLRTAVDSLRNEPRRDDRTAMFCESLESLQQDLALAMERFEDVAPDEVLTESQQYTVEIPAAPPEPPPISSDLGEAVVWAHSLAENLRSTFNEMAASAHKESLGETYRNLAVLVEGYQQRIARLDQDLRDL